MAKILVVYDEPSGSHVVGMLPLQAGVESVEPEHGGSGYCKAQPDNRGLLV